MSVPPAGREALPPRRDIPALLVCGLLWFGAYNVLLNQAERTVDAGTMSTADLPITEVIRAGGIIHGDGQTVMVARDGSTCALERFARRDALHGEHGRDPGAAYAPHAAALAHPARGGARRRGSLLRSPIPWAPKRATSTR